MQRVLADAGLGARRACEAVIEQGRVKVNGKRVDKLPVFVDAEGDRIEVDGRPLPRAQRLVYLMMHKPGRTLTAPGSRADDNRPSALGLIDHPAKPRLMPVGGLDFDSTGLLLFTNDGEMVHRLTHPKYAIERKYHAKVKGEITGSALSKLRKGVFVIPEVFGQEGMPVEKRVFRRTPVAKAFGEQKERKREGHKARKVTMEVSQINASDTLEIVTKVARDDEIVKALTVVGLSVKKMHRVGLGPLWLSAVASGYWRELDRHEISGLKDAVRGKKVTATGKAGQSGSGKTAAGLAGAGSDAGTQGGEAWDDKAMPERTVRKPRVIG